MTRQLELFGPDPVGKAPKVCQLFLSQAKEFALRYLKEHGAASGEDITDACKAAGIVPTSDKWFGHVYQSLSKAGLIKVDGVAPRRRGNGSPGYVWTLTES